VFRCNGETYSNACLITFKEGPMRAHIRAPSILSLLESPAEGSVPEFGRRVRFDALQGWETRPLRLISRTGNSQRSLGARSGEYGGRVMTQEAMCGSVRCCEVEATVPAYHSSHRILPTASRSLCQNFQVQMTSNSLSRWYELTVHQTIQVKEFRELFGCPSYSLAMMSAQNVTQTGTDWL
jgi:hypothetical protein